MRSFSVLFAAASLAFGTNAFLSAADLLAASSPSLAPSATEYRTESFHFGVSTSSPSGTSGSESRVLVFDDVTYPFTVEFSGYAIGGGDPDWGPGGGDASIVVAIFNDHGINVDNFFVSMEYFNWSTDIYPMYSATITLSAGAFGAWRMEQYWSGWGEADITVTWPIPEPAGITLLGWGSLLIFRRSSLR